MEISQRVKSITSQVFVLRKKLIILGPGRGEASFLGVMIDSNLQVMFWFEPLRAVFEKVFKVDVIIQRNELINFRKTRKLIKSFFKYYFSQ